MKVRLQDIVNECDSHRCAGCKYNKNGECLVKIDGYIPYLFLEYVALCCSSPKLAKALCTNEVVEIYENDSKRIN